MKKKILAIIALVVCVATLFTGCKKGLSSEVSISNKLATPFSAEFSKRLDAVNDFDSVKEVNENYYLFTDVNTIKTENGDITTTTVTQANKLYSVKTGEFTDLLDSETQTTTSATGVTSGKKTEVQVVGGDNYVLVRTQSQIKAEGEEWKASGASITLYDNNLNKIAEKAQAKTLNAQLNYLVDFNGDKTAEGAVIGGKFYKAEGESFFETSVEVENLPFSLKDNATVYSKYLHFIEEVDNGEEIKIVTYDFSTLELKNIYLIPSYYNVNEQGLVFFDNGNYLIQASVKLDAFSNDYEFINEDGEKFALKNKLINVDNGEVHDVGCDYILDGAYSKALYTKIADGQISIGKYDAFGVATHKLDRDQKRIIGIEEVMLGIYSDGGIESVNGNIEHQSGPITKLNNGGAIVMNSQNTAYLYSDRGELIKSFGAKNGFEVNDKFIIVDNRVYNFKFEKIFTPNEDAESTKVYVLSDAVIVEEVLNGKTSYTRFTGEKVEVITSYEPSDVTLRCVVKDNFYITLKYSVSALNVTMDICAYNGQGEKLVEIKNVAQNLGTASYSVIEFEGGAIITAKQQVNPIETQTVYYRVG